MIRGFGTSLQSTQVDSGQRRVVVDSSGGFPMVPGVRVQVRWLQSDGSESVKTGVIVEGNEIPAVGDDDDRDPYVLWSDGGFVALDLLKRDVALNHTRIERVPPPF